MQFSERRAAEMPNIISKEKAGGESPPTRRAGQAPISMLNIQQRGEGDAAAKGGGEMLGSTVPRTQM